MSQWYSLSSKESLREWFYAVKCFNHHLSITDICKENLGISLLYVFKWQKQQQQTSNSPDWRSHLLHSSAQHWSPLSLCAQPRSVHSAHPRQKPWHRQIFIVRYVKEPKTPIDKFQTTFGIHLGRIPTFLQNGAQRTIHCLMSKNKELIVDFRKKTPKTQTKFRWRSVGDKEISENDLFQQELIEILCLVNVKVKDSFCSLKY